MRGKVVLKESACNGVGITPAYAGKSFGHVSCHISHWDHPRICGEKRFVLIRFAVELGSPPHMRGKVTEHGADKAHHGITPAYAGKRKDGEIFGYQEWDHPRICGEKTKKIP